MNQTNKKTKTIDEYISSAPKQTQKHLREMRAILKKIAPKATEEIRWRMLAFVDRRILFMYAAFKNHLGLFSTPSAMKPFKKDLAKFVTGKGSIQFPYNQSFPRVLISKIAKYRVKDLRENDTKWM